MTIQPNFSRCPPRSLKVGTGGGAYADAEKAWALLGALFHELDAVRTGCPAPAYLAPWQRFQGIAALEKHTTNPHIHLLLSFPDWKDQFWAGMVLLDMLDNVDKRREDPRDEHWQQNAWDYVRRGTQWSRSPDRIRTESLLTGWAPAGTAMVQIVRTEWDLEKVCRYMTKTWHESTSRLAARKVTTAYDPTFDFKELREFQVSIDPSRYARNYAIDPVTDGQTLNLDKPEMWKSKGKTLR